MSKFAEQYLGSSARILFTLVLISFFSLSAVAQSASPVATQSSDAQTYTESVVYDFQGRPDGQNPLGLIRDSSGNLYGGTLNGGDYGYGSVFELTPNGSGGYNYKQIYSVGGWDDGGVLLEGLTIDSQGNLYGWQSGCSLPGGDNGAVFELSPGSGGNWVVSNAYAFTGLSDGCDPNSVVVDSTGNVYGLSGPLFELTTADNQWSEQTLYVFAPDLGGPANLIMDKKGDLYGTTSGYNSAPNVFKLHYSAKRGWVLTILHAFQGSPNDGGYPYGNLALDSDGNIYGTAENGLLGYGGVYKLTPSGKITWLYAFTGGADGYAPAGVTFDNAGNLYGGAGSTIVNQYCQGGCGEVYKLTPPSRGQTTWSQNVLYSFTGGADGGSPDALGTLIVDDAGNVYGTTGYGGINYGTYGFGVVFKLAPNPVATATTITKNSPNPSITGQVVTVGLTVTQTVKANSKPTGTVTVNASTGESCVAALPPNGKTSCKILFATAGTRTLTATYSGDVADLGSVSEAVTESTFNTTATTIIEHTPDPTKVGQTVTVHFTVEAKNGTKQTKPTGSVTVTASTGESCTGTLSGADEGKCQLSFSSEGIDTLIATYAGDADNEGSVSKTVEQAVE
jgi:Bacterial Ig-like domain (group 3)